MTAKKPGPERRLLSAASVAAILDCSPSHVYRLIGDGSLTAIETKTKGAKRPKVRIEAKELDTFIAKRTVKAPARRSA